LNPSLHRYVSGTSQQRLCSHLRCTRVSRAHARPSGRQMRNAKVDAHYVLDHERSYNMQLSAPRLNSQHEQ
jgi:hypothetical protein